MRLVEPHELVEPQSDVKYTLGLDLGQRQDYTAIAIGAWSRHDEGHAVDVRFLERLPLGTPYPEVVSYVDDLLHRQPLRGQCDLVVDATGVGRPVVDLFRQAGRDPVSVTITGGITHVEDNDGHRVPKRDLVSAVQVGLQTRTLRVALELPHSETLRDELAGFQVKVTTAANDTYGAWREGQHDDLVLAVAMVAWWVRNAPAPAELL